MKRREPCNPHSLAVPFACQVINRLESDVREKLGNSHRLLVRSRCEPRNIPIQAYSWTKYTERRAHYLSHPHMCDKSAFDTTREGLPMVPADRLDRLGPGVKAVLVDFYHLKWVTQTSQNRENRTFPNSTVS